MRKGNVLVYVLTAVAVAAVGVAVWALLRPSASASAEKGVKDRSIAKVLKSEKQTDKESRDARRTASRERRRQFVKFEEDAKAKPEISLEKEDEEKLSVFCKEVLKEIQRALDTENLNALVVVLEKIRVQMVDAKGNGVDVDSVIPPSVRIRAIEACGWFGAQTLPEIIDSMVDANEEVRQMSIEQYQTALEDPKFGDYDRAELIKAAAQAMHDRDALDTIFTSITDMRNSLIAETVIDVMKNGTDVAKDLMKEQLEFYTESDIETPEDVQRWLSENPDDPEDDEFYGPQETEDDE